MTASLRRGLFAGLSIVFAGLALLGPPQPARAATVLYDNFTASSLTFGNNWLLLPSGSTALSDSFTLSQASIVTGVNFGAVFSSASGPASQIEFGITTVPATFPVSGTAALTTGPTGDNGGSLEDAIVSFSTGPIPLAAGTYYLVLQHPDVRISVDESGGPSSATYRNSNGIVGSENSESFQILGDVATPLPAALPLFASGLGGLLLLARRRKKRAAA